MWSDFNNSFTFALSDKLRKRQKPMLPPHLISVATLPCEMWMFNFAPLQQLFHTKIMKNYSSPWIYIMVAICFFVCLLARDAQAKLALIVTQCLSIHLSICPSVCLSATAWVTCMYAALRVASHVDYRLVFKTSAQWASSCARHSSIEGVNDALFILS